MRPDAGSLPGQDGPARLGSEPREAARPAVRGATLDLRLGAERYREPRRLPAVDWGALECRVQAREGNESQNCVLYT
ncbi:hypothetical protein SK128_003917, partial [Halocaridina rubra]